MTFNEMVEMQKIMHIVYIRLDQWYNLSLWNFTSAKLKIFKKVTNRILKKVTNSFLYTFFMHILCNMSWSTSTPTTFTYTQWRFKPARASSLSALSSHLTLWVAKDPQLLKGASEYPDQNAQMHRPIRVTTRDIHANRRNHCAQNHTTKYFKF